MSAEDVLGIVANGPLPYEFNMLTRGAVPVGEYVVARSAGDEEVLGMVDGSTINSEMMGMARTFEDAYAAGRLSAANPRDKSYVSHVRVLGLLDGLRSGEVRMPSLPPVPGSEVRKASEAELSEVFGGSGARWVPIGSLLRRASVRVHVDVNKVATRHLAILASTGAGKSNLLALIAKSVARLRGTMVLFDYHGEYQGLSLEGREMMVSPAINPRDLDPDELADLLEVRESASKQRYVLSQALKEARGAKDFWGGLREAIKENGKGEYEGASQRLLDIVDSALRRIGPVLDPESPPPLKLLAEGYVNVVDLSGLSPRQADIVISHYLDEILEDRKRAISGGDAHLRKPVLVAIEEAHVFVPGGKDERTRSAGPAARIAREGRKFGVSLIIVSQRPSRLNQDVLSQMGSLAIGRLLSARDRSFVLESSEYLTDEISEYLPDLNPGEAILVGQWVKLPAVVKVDLVGEKLRGKDLDVVGEWTSWGGPSEDTDELMMR